MYNYSLLLGYPSEDDTEYRRELLAVFGLSSYSTALTDAIKELYKEVDGHFKEILEQLRRDSCLPFLLKEDIDSFTLLFSWDHFHNMHQYLGEILSHGDNIEREKKVLLSHLRKK